MLSALVGDRVAIVTGREPFTPTYAPRPAYHVSTLANSLVEDRAETYDESYGADMGRPEGGLGRLAWDATARLAQRLAAGKVRFALTMKCGKFPADVVVEGPAPGSYLDMARKMAMSMASEPGFSSLSVVTGRGCVGFRPRQG
jgi:hypothetical protein